MRRPWFFFILMASFLLSAKPPETLPSYKPMAKLEGQLVLVGSDSMDPLLLLWIGEFQKLHPSAKISTVSKGSLTAPPALAAKETVLGPMSRPMKAAELEQVEKALGYRPTQVVVAYDALAIWVNRANPLKRITMEQLDGIFSKTRNLGWEVAIDQWGDLGLHGEWRRRDIVPYGRNALSGTRSFFEEHALGKGQMTQSYKVGDDQWAVVEAPGTDPRGISYGPINYAGPSVRQLPIVPQYKSEGVLPSLATIRSGAYPLTRTLSIYLAADEAHGLPPLAKEFMRFVLSREGQALVVSYGSVPVPSELAASQLAVVERP